MNRYSTHTRCFSVTKNDLTQKVFLVFRTDFSDKEMCGMWPPGNVTGWPLRAHVFIRDFYGIPHPTGSPLPSQDFVFQAVGPRVDTWLGTLSVIGRFWQSDISSGDTRSSAIVPCGKSPSKKFEFAEIVSAGPFKKSD